MVYIFSLASLENKQTNKKTEQAKVFKNTEGVMLLLNSKKQSRFQLRFCGPRIPGLGVGMSATPDLSFLMHTLKQQIMDLIVGALLSQWQSSTETLVPGFS